MMLEYGPVEIGGKQYACPHRSVVMMRDRTVSTLTVRGKTSDIYAPYETLLSNIAYAAYRKFRGGSSYAYGGRRCPGRGSISGSQPPVFPAAANALD